MNLQYLINYFPEGNFKVLKQFGYNFEIEL